MQFHYHKQEIKITFKKSIQQYKGLLFKNINPKLDIYRDKSISFRNGRVIGKTWIQDITCFDEEIEDYSFHKRGCHIVLRNSLDIIRVISENFITLRIRKNATHRIQLNEENYINYHEGTLNGQPNKLITQNSYYIEEMNCAINQNQLIPIGIKIEPLIKYSKIRCIKLSEETYCIQQINKEQCLNILIHQDKQIPFYNDVLYLEGQLSYINGYFLLYNNEKLQMINQNGIEYEETLHGQCYLDGSEIFILRDISIDEQLVKNTIDFTIKVTGVLLKIQIITKSLKLKMMLEENQIPPQEIPDYLVKINDQKFIKETVKKLWKQKSINKTQLIEIYNVLVGMKRSNKLRGKLNLIQCYETENLDNLSFLNCISSETCDLQQIIKLFQNHIIYNYIHFLNLIIKHKPQFLDEVLPNGTLFLNFEPLELGTLSKQNKLNDLSFLGTYNVPQIQTNYQKIATQFLIQCHGIYYLPIQQEDFTFFLYTLLIKGGQSRLTLKQFMQEQDKLHTLFTYSSKIESLFGQLNQYYQEHNLNWFDEMLNQLRKTQYPVQIFQSILDYCPNLTTKEYLVPVNLAFERLLTFSTDNYQLFQQLLDSFIFIRNSFDQDEYDQLQNLISLLQQSTILSQIISNFNVVYQLNTIINKIMQNPEESQKCIEQLLENYHVNRVKQMQFKIQDKIFNLQNQNELKQCFSFGFKNYIKDEKKIELSIFKKNLEFGKYRDVKLLCQTFNLSINQFDEAISDAMYRYLQLQKKIDYIEDERKKFLEIVNEIQKIKKEKLVQTKKTMSLYKFIIESKEVGNYKDLDLFKCNQILFQIYRRTQNLDLPYLRLKKKLAKANNLAIYDREFCKFMIDLAQKNFNIKPQKAQLILDDLSKNGDEIIQSEVSIILLQFSKDENQKREQYWKVLKQSSSADTVQTLLKFQQKQTKQIQLMPQKIEIISKELIEASLDNSISIAKFEQEYKKFYSENLIDVVFLDTLLKDPQEAFFLLSIKQSQNTKLLIQKLVQSQLLNSEKILNYYIQTFVKPFNVINLLQGDDKELEELAQALVISQHKQIFDKRCIFNKNERLNQIMERLDTLELDNIIPELLYFKDLNIKELKIQNFIKRIQQTNLRQYYKNQEQSLTSYVKNQIKRNPEIINIQIDLRYHFIIYEDIYGFTIKEKYLIRSFIYQCIESNKSIQNYDNIYKQIISKEFNFEQVKEDFYQIIELECLFIISEIAKYYYQKQEEVIQFYCQKLLSSSQCNDEITFWQKQDPQNQIRNILLDTLKKQNQSLQLNNELRSLIV
ncbi:unnamed protein product [Paramecium pentaurelia]|uniref:Uncharacterized protein n=1 Tax=Paramecium pentaurelia TaxID=43138 RepID=A0A8S1S5P8_9CILI|nr:unnamed protein product [Paramecium pentaurelia]